MTSLKSILLLYKLRIDAHYVHLLEGVVVVLCGVVVVVGGGIVVGRTVVCGSENKNKHEKQKCGKQ